MNLCQCGLEICARPIDQNEVAIQNQNIGTNEVPVSQTVFSLLDADHEILSCLV